VAPPQLISPRMDCLISPAPGASGRKLMKISDPRLGRLHLLIWSACGNPPGGRCKPPCKVHPDNNPSACQVCGRSGRSGRSAC